MPESSLFQPFDLFGLALKNRVVMSSMSRSFAGPGHVPTDLMRDYYARRAENGVGLILTEGTIVHPSGDGYPSVPYVCGPEPIAGWKPIVEKVHAYQTVLFCQLWHCGRISHPDFLDGALPVSSSAVKPDGVTSRTKKPFVTPRALNLREIPEIVEMFAAGARNARIAGFDGVEIHGGHGYLIDQFLDGRINQRVDEYGGSIQNRCRFLLDVVKGVVSEIGSGRVALRISPSREMNGLYEWPDMEAMLDYLVPQLVSAGLKILDVSCARADYFKTSGKVVRRLRPLWPHILLGGASLSRREAEKELSDGWLDLVTWGRHILANPDFAERLRSGRELIPYDAGMLNTLA